MYGLKNLVAKGILNDQNYTLLRKKSEEYRRSINYFSGHIHQMVQVYHNYYELFENNVSEASTQLQNSKDASQQLYVDVVRLFCGMNVELRKFVEKASGNQKGMVELSNVFMTDYNVLIEEFQIKGREYFESEQNVVETCKKYNLSYKEMMAKIQAYKNTFLDVKLVYNTQEKLRLYNDCLQNYKRLFEVAKLIQIKVDDLNQKKSALTEAYKVLEKQLQNFTIAFASRYIQELRKFYEGLFKLQRNRLHIFAQRMIHLDNSLFPSYFEAEGNLNYQEFISQKMNPDSCKVIPSFLVYSSKLKEEGVFRFRRFMVSYLYEMMVKAERRKRLGKKMLDFVRNYIRGLDKSLGEWIKQTLTSFEKMRRKIGQAFGTRWISFYKILASIFEYYMQNTGRLILRTNTIFQKIQSYLAQESSMMDEFLRELKTFVEKQVHRKILKLYSSQKEWKQQNLINEEKAISQDQIFQGSQFMKGLIQRYSQNGVKIYQEGRQVYRSFVVEVKQSLTQYFTYFNEIQNTYYDEQQYAKSYQIFQDQISVSIKKGMSFFSQMPLSALVKESGKIIFDNEFNKIQGFKKIKKPRQFEQLQDRNVGSVNMSSAQTVENAHLSNMSAPQQLPTKKISDSITNMLNREVFMGQSKSKHSQFLLKKIIVQTNQKYIKSYSCSFSDTVILAGRLFITSSRLCFFSKFNSSNLFFGQTFIDIPKNDIRKVEKRSMSFLSDNAISIDTSHGSMIFRSFFSRNAAYTLIKKNFEINNQEIFFDEDQNVEENNLMEQQLEFQDDLKEEAGKERQEKLVKTIKEWSYVNVQEQQFTFFGLTVVKFLKLFELDQQVVINRTNFNSFLHFYKDLCEHTDINIEPWTPNPLEYLNVINIKEDSPETFCRKVIAVIPLPPSGIPFMPKTSLTTEEQTMFLINGNKVVIESVISNSGVPYCQAFDVRLKRVIQSAGQNKVKVSSFVFVNFNQNVMVKATIDAKTIQTTKENMVRQSEEIKGYLKILQKKMMKGNKKQTPEDKIKQQEEIIEQLEGKVKEMKDEGKHLQLKVTELTQKFKISGIAALVLLVLVIIQAILLLG